MKFDKMVLDQWLGKKWNAAKECPICEKNAWGIIDDLMAIKPVPAPGESNENDKAIPIVAIVCGNCGLMYPFSALITKVIQPKED